MVPLDNAPPPAAQSVERGLWRGDSLLASMLFLVGLTLAQRLVGVVRNLLFCGLLADEQLGRWSLAFNFLLLAAPLVVLGIPGSLGRYSEHYRRRDQLQAFLRRAVLITVVAALAGASLLVVAPHGFAWLLFGDAERIGLVQLLGCVLVSVVVFNLLVELLTALRLVRFASLMQLVSSVSFAIIGTALLLSTGQGETAVLLSFGAAAAIASLVGIAVVIRFIKGLPRPVEPLSNAALWSKLAPFAFWIWAGNLITNLFEVSDQFMLKHFAGLAPAAADSLVGQYYCSRVVPLLMISAACMFASSLVPHLTRDWDAGRRTVVRQRVQLVLKTGAIALTVAAAIVLVSAPLLFGLVLRGKYDTGLAVLPTTLTYCVWYCLGCLATSYLLCAERAKWGSLALMLGLVTNLALNYLWAPQYGLAGVVAATATANAVGLISIMLLGRRVGLKLDHGVWLASLLPLTLLLGGWAALAIVAVVSTVTVWHPWVFNEHEGAELRAAAALQIDRLRRYVRREVSLST